MSEERNPRDEGWVRTVAEHYGPEPLDAAGRARFDARLREGLDAARASWPGEGRLPRALAPVVLVVFLVTSLWWGWTTAPEEQLAQRPTAPEGRLAQMLTVDRSRVAVPDTEAIVAWEWELLLGSETREDALGDADLPEEFAAIGSAFLGYGNGETR